VAERDKDCPVTMHRSVRRGHAREAHVVNDSSEDEEPRSENAEEQTERGPLVTMCYIEETRRANRTKERRANRSRLKERTRNAKWTGATCWRQSRVCTPFHTEFSADVGGASICDLSEGGDARNKERDWMCC
jgi:hypothetical protein